MHALKDPNLVEKLSILVASGKPVLVRTAWQRAWPAQAEQAAEMDAGFDRTAV
jgi:hypothetical protein